MKELIWLIPLLPFIGALLNGFVLRGRIGKRLVGAIGCGSVLLSLATAVGVLGSYLGSAEFAAHRAFEKTVYLWVPAGMVGFADGSFADFTVDMGFLLDPLSAVMLLVVTLVGFLIHVYSVGYMGEDPGYQRYFAYLNLFMGAMLLLVLGNNYLVMFVGWEGVGLCSYLLIGFWFEEEFPPYAGRKAFIVNRIGDFAFLVGLFALVSRFGSLSFTEIFPRLAASPGLGEAPYVAGMSFAGFVALCLFIGAMGKSAQLPLYVWLPDAMAGPTPVSALIHAATMVTAGVYMVARSNVLYQLAPGVSWLVAGIGCATAIFAATIGLAQTDIKKVLAYSTVSQLGYMFLAAGVGAYTAAIFHLATHAFFKALLFLGSGSVIHAMGGEQDMRRMGGLKRHLPVTYWTFLIGTLAIAGVPGLAGFFSKDRILAAAFEGQAVLWCVGLLTAGLTACYMFRAVFLTFHGEFRGSAEEREHLHESPRVMTVPLMLLAVGSVSAGWLGVPRLGELDIDWFGHFLEPVVAPLAALHGEGHGAHHPSLGLELALMALSVAVALGGIAVAWKIWGGGRGLAGGEAWAGRFPALHRLLVGKYWVDELYDRTVVKPVRALAAGCFKVVDGIVIEGAVHTGPFLARVAGDLARFTTTGNLRNYALYFFAGVLFLFWWLVF